MLRSLLALLLASAPGMAAFRASAVTVDIGLRATAGVLVTGFGGAPNNQLGDGVNSNDVPYLDRFPFHAAPHAGFLHSGKEGTNGRGTPTN